MFDVDLLQGLNSTGANLSKFSFRVQGLPDGALAVQGFTGTGHALSSGYLFAVEVLASARIEGGALLGKGAMLELAPGELPIHGVIASFEYRGRSADGHRHGAELVSPLYPLALGRSNRVFIRRSAPQILEELARDAGIEVRLQLSESYPEREYIVQYDESDFNFLCRLAASWGIFFRFEQTQDGARLLFHDATEELPSAGEILYREHSGTVRPEGTVFALSPRARLLAGRVELRDYNYRTPETVLQVAASPEGTAPGAGVQGRYWENAKDLDEAQRLARLRQQALDGGRETFVAETDCRRLAPGVRFTLSGHPEPHLNGDYRVIEAEHKGDQRAGFATGGDARGMTYRNRLVLVRAGVPWRPALPERQRVHGTFTARVESPCGEYAHLDEEGRYCVRLDFDGGNAPAAGASHPMRMVQPYGGNQFGMHFPLHAGTEVVLACVGGDLDRPVILGALPNPATPTVVTAANATQNVVRTWGGNELLMEDRVGKEKVELFTRSRKNILTLDADGEGHRVRLATEEGKMEVFAARMILLESGETHTVESGGDHLVTVENAQRLITRTGEIVQEAATDICLRAGENIRMQTDREDIELSAARDLVAEVGNACSIEVRQGNLTLKVKNGRISIQAARAITVRGQGGGTIHIGQGGGQIEIARDGSIDIEAPRVEIVGNTVDLKGGMNRQGGAGGWGAAPLLAPDDPVEKHFAEPAKPELVIGVFFDGTGNNKNAEPAEKNTNVAKLWDLYESPITDPIYIQGVGTKAESGKTQKSLLGLGMGIGIFGGGERLIEAREIVLRELEKYKASYGIPERIIFDVFGFSRGAMLARHFVNMVNAGLPDLQGEPVAGTPPIFPDLRSTDPHQQSSSSAQQQGDVQGFELPPLMYPRLAASVQVRFLGIFDSVGSFFMPGDADEGYINASLAASSAGFVYHLTARNEIRANFPLTRICGGDGTCPPNFVEEELYGVHSDIGGGYDGEPEEFYVADELYRPDRRYADSGEPERSGEDDPEWLARMRQKAQQVGCQVRFEGNTACFFEMRPTKPELALVALHAMHDKAVAQGVPLRKFKDINVIPVELSDLLARATKNDHAAFKKLDELYIHTSHRKFLLAHLGQTFGMGPAKNNFRQCFPNHHEDAILPAPKSERAIK